MRLIIITPILALDKSFPKTLVSVANNLSDNDLWLICLDSASLLEEDDIEDFLKDTLKSNQYKVIKKSKQPYAGNARNSGLDYLEKEKFPFILSFLDADDFIKHNYSQEIKKYFKNNKSGVVSFSYERHKKGKVYNVVHPIKKELYDDFKYFYNTAPLSTAVMINDKKVLSAARFGKRKRANDQKYFLDIVKYFGYVHYQSVSIAIYNIKSGSLSNIKYKMPFYKLLALHDHGIKKTQSFFILLYYAYRGFLRHFLGKEK